MSKAKDHRLVVITGGTGGIGRATAVRFAHEGCDVVVLARGQERLDDTVRQLEGLGVRALGISLDVADAAAVEAAAARIERELRPIDVWINDAMTDVFAPALDITAEEYRRVTEVCYLGYVHGTLSALKRMTARNRGHLIFVGSAVAYRGIPLQAAYSGAKHAIQGFFDSLRTELIHDGSAVRLTMVQMPAVNTPQFNWCRSKLPEKAQPLPPIYQPEVAADAIYFASTTDRREFWVGGSTVKGIIGNRLAPNFADHYLARKGLSGQTTGEPKPASHQDNLFEPASGLFGAHGDFDGRARPASLQLWASKNRRALGVGALVATGLALVGSRDRRRRRAAAR
ncbi:MAG TPA: SDR family oxidoreductase [Opitutus sp.]|nr:SDR family oxidoreductase [Opitutus sp.]